MGLQLLLQILASPGAGTCKDRPTEVNLVRREEVAKSQWFVNIQTSLPVGPSKTGKGLREGAVCRARDK